MRSLPNRRSGFTLVELMVSAALCILIMSILAGAFSAALESLSLLRSIGGMAERLRSTHTQLSEDLKSAHFEGGDSTSGQRVSDIRYDFALATGSQGAPPAGGFFFIRTPATVYEGMDQDNVFSTRATDHAIGMTVRRTGKTPDQLFTADLGTALPAAIRAQFLSQNATDTAPANTFVSNWAEVYWFLGNPQQLGGVTNHTLYRRARLLTTTEITIPVATAGATELAQVISCRVVGANYVTNTVITIRDPRNRLPFQQVASRSAIPQQFPVTSAKYGDDIVLTNVISFEVKAAWTAGPGVPYSPRLNVPLNTNAASGTPVPGPVAGWPGTAAQVPNGDFPFDDLPPVTENNAPDYAGGPLTPRMFDSWYPAVTGGMTPTNWYTPGSGDSLPFRARITGVKIKIRTFDVKPQQTRQSTLVVDL